MQPSSAEEAAAVLAHCAARKLAVVIQGGNTGLVGGATPVHDEIVMSVARIRFGHGPVGSEED